MIASQTELFGELYGTAAMRAVFSVPRRLDAMLEVEAALARAQGRLGVIPADAAKAIDAAADVEQLDVDAIVASAQNVGYPVVPLTRQLARLAGEAGGYVHWGATTQDVLDTATVLQLGEAFGLLEHELRGIVAALAQRARDERDTVMAGRTHLQHALPVTFGYVVATWLAPLVDHLIEMRALRERVRVLQFGGAAGTLASLGENGREVALALGEELGLRVPDAPWHADRSTFAHACSFVGIVCGSAAKLATDVMLLMQTEVAEVFEPHEPGRGGSSTMPQKRNPIACEYVLATTRAVHALVPLTLAAMPGDHQRSTGPWQSEELALPPIFVYASAALAHARTIARGMTVDRERMRANLAASGGLIASEAVAMALAEKVGKAQAHHLVEQGVSTALAGGRTLLDVLSADAGIAQHFDRAALARLLDPSAYVGEAGAVVDRVVRAANDALHPTKED